MKPKLYPSLSEPAFFASCDRVWRETAAADGASVIRPAPLEVAVKYGAPDTGSVSFERDVSLGSPESRHNHEMPHFNPPIKPYLPTLNAHNPNPFAKPPPP